MRALALLLLPTRTNLCTILDDGGGDLRVAKVCEARVAPKRHRCAAAAGGEAMNVNFAH